MPLTADQIAFAWEWAKKVSPVCLLTLFIMGGAGYNYAGQTFATKASVDELRESIDHGFTSIGTRIDYSDADSRVRDVQQQIRLKEREIADLEMVISEMENPQSDSGNVLKNRAFAAKQDLDELRGQAQQAQAARAEAERKYRESSR